ncbi:MAG: sulfurtransferase TusA family protein [Methanomassiliicoccales archaeon]|jgi:tRNA 2-thiouridine synthesizing protein A
MADEKVDCKGMVCPRPLFETLKRMKRIPVGATVEVVGDYPLSLVEIKEHMENEGQEVVSSSSEGDVWRIVIRKVK